MLRHGLTRLREQFCTESRAILKSCKPLRQRAAPRWPIGWRGLLANPAFVAETFNTDMKPGKHVLHHDPELDFYVMAHVQEGGKTGKPHSHGESWAIYGNARNATRDDRNGGAPIRTPTTMPSSRRRADTALSLGQDPGLHGPNVIHSTAHPGQGRLAVIRESPAPTSTSCRATTSARRTRFWRARERGGHRSVSPAARPREGASPDISQIEVPERRISESCFARTTFDRFEARPDADRV